MTISAAVRSREEVVGGGDGERVAPKGYWGMIGWLRRQPLVVRMPLYAVCAVLMFGLAVGLGAAGALVLQGGGLLFPAREEPRPAGEQQNAPGPQERESAAVQEESTTERIERVMNLAENRIRMRIPQLARFTVGPPFSAFASHS